MARSVFEIWGEITLKGADEVKTKLEKIGTSVKETGEKMKGIGEGLSTHVTAPLAVLGAGAVASAIQVDSAAGSMQAKLGLTGEEADRLSAKAQDLWRQGFGADMADVTNKVANVTAVMGELNDQDLHDVVAGVDVLEQQFGADLQGSVRASKILMETFGMSASESLDYLTVGFQEGLDYSGEFLDTISEYSTYFSDMGFSGDAFFSTLQSGAESGAFQLDKVGDAMKEFSIRSKETGESTTGAFDALGLSSTEMISAFNAGGAEAQDAFGKTVTALQGVEDETKRNEIAVALFGTQYEDLGEQAFDALLTAGDGFKNVEGASRTASEAMRDNFGVDLQILWRELQTALLPLGQTLIDLAQRAMPYVTAAVEKLTTWFNGLSAESQKGVVIFGLIAAAIGPLLVIFGTIAGAIGTLIPHIITVWGWISKLKTAFTAIRTAMLLFSGPVGWVILAIMALVAAGIALYKNWDTVKAWLSNIWNSVWTKAKEIFTNIKEAIVSKFEEAKAKLEFAWNNMKRIALTKALEIYSNVKSTFEKVKSAIMDPVNKAKDKVGDAIEKIKGFFSSLKGKLKIELPHIKMPKFSIKNWSANPANWIKAPPRLSVTWAAKGGIFDKGAHLLGIGEDGPEGVFPLSGAKKMAPFAKAIASHMPAAGAGGAFQVIVPVYLDGREIARAAAPGMDEELETIRRRAARNRGITR